MSDFSHRLKQLRLTHNLTQAELAKKLNVTQNAVHQWENRKTEPSAEMIEKIAAFFNVMPAFLMGWGEKKSLNDVITENIKKYRKRLNVTQSDLAEYIGVSVEHINKIESGYILPTADELIKIAEGLWVSVDQILSIPELTSEQHRDAFISKILYENGYSMFKTFSNNRESYWIINNSTFYEIDVNTIESFLQSIGNYVSYSFEKMLSKFTPKYRKEDTPDES